MRILSKSYSQIVQFRRIQTDLRKYLSTHGGFVGTFWGKHSLSPFIPLRESEIEVYELKHPDDVKSRPLGKVDIVGNAANLSESLVFTIELMIPKCRAQDRVWELDLLQILGPGSRIVNQEDMIADTVSQVSAFLGETAGQKLERRIRLDEMIMEEQFRAFLGDARDGTRVD